MNVTEFDEVQYCTNCGSANKKSDVVCDECGKKIIVHHRPFWDFVKKHTKTGVKEKLKSELFDAFKKFLFKHLYGTVVSFLIAGMVTTVVVTSTPYIKPVTAFPEQTILKMPQNSFELSEEVHSNLWYSVLIYTIKIFEDSVYVRENITWDEPDKYADASEMLAENCIEGYTWRGRHDMYTNPIDIELGEDLAWEYSTGDKRPTQYRKWVKSSVVTGADVTSELGKELYKNGYHVVEGDYYMMMFYSLFEYDNNAPPPLEKNPYKLLKYRILLTKKPEGGRWYVAEDVLVERKGV